MNLPIILYSCFILNTNDLIVFRLSKQGNNSTLCPKKRLWEKLIVNSLLSCSRPLKTKNTCTCSWNLVSVENFGLYWGKYTIIYLTSQNKYRKFSITDEISVTRNLVIMYFILSSINHLYSIIIGVLIISYNIVYWIIYTNTNFETKIPSPLFMSMKY